MRRIGQSKQPPGQRDEDQAVRLVGASEAEALRALLCRDECSNLFILSWLENYGLSPGHGARAFFFVATRDASGDLSAVALGIGQSLAMLFAPQPANARRLGRWFRQRGVILDHIVSGRPSVESFWQAYRTAPGAGRVRARRQSEQHFYVLEREHLPARLSAESPEHLSESSSPGQVPGTTGVRLARQAELDAVFLASARMHQEETGENPLRTNPMSFRQHVANRISSGRCYVLFDERRRLLFKCDLSAVSSFGTQLAGVYTAPQFRGQGIATRAIFDICHELFDAGTRRITLYVMADNVAAHRVYQKVGFEFHAPYQTVFIESDFSEPDCLESDNPES